MRQEDEGLNEYAVARHEKALEVARTERMKLWGGAMLGLVSLAIAIYGMVAHDQFQMVGGLVFAAVGFKIIPITEALKLWPWGRKDATTP